MLGFSHEFFCPVSTQLARCSIRDNSTDAFVISALFFLGAVGGGWGGGGVCVVAGLACCYCGLMSLAR